MWSTSVQPTNDIGKEHHGKTSALLRKIYKMPTFSQGVSDQLDFKLQHTINVEILPHNLVDHDLPHGYLAQDNPDTSVRNTPDTQ